MFGGRDFNFKGALKNLTIPVVSVCSFYRGGLVFSLALFITLFPLAKTAHSAPSHIVLSTWSTSSPFSKGNETRTTVLVIKEAFRRIGISVSIETLPSERSLINANQGITDGEFLRISGLDKIYPNLIQVPEKITDFEFVAFSKKIDIQTTSWESLKPYSVAIVTGWKILEKNIVGTRNRIEVEDVYHLFKLLSLGRTDIVVFERLAGIEMAKSLSLQGVKVLEPPLAKRAMFLYLHKSHKTLVPLVASALKEIKNDGTYEKIISEGLADWRP